MLRNCVIGLACFLLLTTMGYGQEKRNLLEKSLEGRELPELSQVVYPVYRDRTFWDTIPEKVKKLAVKKAEESRQKGIYSVPLTAYLEYVRIGNRKNCDELEGAQRGQLRDLVLGELMEGKGRFLDAIIDQVWVLCERSTWVGTAHLASQKRGAGVPDVNDVIIDLHSGETAVLIAWTYYFFKDEFHKVSPLISERILQELDKRIFQPYLTRDNLWWMGFKGSFVNNWNVWCNYNVLMCALLAEEDMQIKRQIVRKTMASVDHFINYYKEDGGCEEGPAYWGHAPGKLMEYLEALRDATRGQIDLFNEPLIARMGKYIAQVHIDSAWFVNFADASALNYSVPTVIYRYGKNVHDAELMAFGKYMGDLSGTSANPLKGSISMILPDLLMRREYEQCTGKAPLYKSVWMDGIQVAAGREKANTNKGLFFAAKGGYNDESHNHNDAGSFVLYKNGKPLLIDAGVGTYTSKTFSRQRYDIWNMQSAWHNLPVINGQQQGYGRKFRAGDVYFSDNGRRIVFSMQLAGAYPAQAACKEWKRTYTFVRGNSLKITDHYELEEVKGRSCLHFLTCCPVKIQKAGKIILGEGENQLSMMYDPEKFEVEVEEKQMDDDRMIKVWGTQIYRIVLEYKQPALKDDSVITFK